MAKKTKKCPSCDGTGRCPHCRGTGMGYDSYGKQSPSIVCPRCLGARVCPECWGSREIEVEE